MDLRDTSITTAFIRQVRRRWVLQNLLFSALTGGVGGAAVGLLVSGRLALLTSVAGVIVGLVLAEKPSLARTADYLDTLWNLPQTLGTFCRAKVESRPLLANAADRCISGRTDITLPRNPRPLILAMTAAFGMGALAGTGYLPTFPSNGGGTEAESGGESIVSGLIGETASARPSLLNRREGDARDLRLAASSDVAAGSDQQTRNPAAGDGSQAVTTTGTKMLDNATAAPRRVEGTETGDIAPASTGAAIEDGEASASGIGRVASVRPRSDPPGEVELLRDGSRETPPAWADLPVRYHAVARRYFADD